MTPGVHSAAGRVSLLVGLARPALVVMKQLLEDAHADLLYRGTDGLVTKTGLRAETVRNSLDVLEVRGIIRRWRDCSRMSRVRFVEIVPIGHKMPVPERRGGKQESRSVSRGTREERT